MVAPNALTWLLVWIAGVYLASAALYLGQALWSGWNGPRRLERYLRGRVIVRDAVHSGRVAEADMHTLRRLSRDQQLALLREVLQSMAGESRRRARALADDLKLVAWAEARCGSRLWWRRLEGARVLTLLDAGEEVVPRLFHDAHVEIRTQAAEWAASHPSPGNIERLISLLPDPQRLCRFTVQDSLLRIGAPAAEPLRTYLQTRSGPAVDAALAVAVGFAGPEFRDPGLALSRDPDPVVRARAATLLGAIGGEEVEEALLQLLSDVDPRPRAAAAAALGTLGVQRAASGLAERLADSAWIVRREAGLALQALGSPGLLFLRRTLRSDDPFAADMARHVLDSPESHLRRRLVTR